MCLYACACLCECMWRVFRCAQRPEEGFRSPGAGPHGFWEPDLDSLAPLTPEPSLGPQEPESTFYCIVNQDEMNAQEMYVTQDGSWMQDQASLATRSPITIVHVVQPLENEHSSQVGYDTYLCSADVAGGFVSPDVLFSGLKSKAIHFFPCGIPESRQHMYSAQVITAQECPRRTCFPSWRGLSRLVWMQVHKKASFQMSIFSIGLSIGLQFELQGTEACTIKPEAVKENLPGITLPNRWDQGVCHSISMANRGERVIDWENRISPLEVWRDWMLIKKTEKEC